MATLTKGKTFVNGELVTPAKIHQLVDAATVTAIATADISNNAITTAKIADSAITSAKIAEGTIVNADIASNAAIADTKLATISTAGKVSNAATTATSANTANAIVSRDDSGNFSANTISAFEFRTPTSFSARASGIIDATENNVSSNYLDINIGADASQISGTTFGSAQSQTTIARFRKYDLFNVSATTIGSITATGTSTQATGVAYNTTSDYRLKTNVEPLTNALSRLSQIPVHRFHFIGGEAGPKVDGFLAHEAQAVVPESVTGTKDAVDADGTPAYQGIDQSKLVPLLVAAVQELAARVASFESL
jgi:hypothetical protein